MSLYYPPSQNALQKQLAADLDTGVTDTMTLNNTTNIPNKPGVCVIDRVDGTGSLKSSSVREFIAYTGTSGSTLTGLTRNIDNSSSDQDHAIGAIVEFVSDVTWAQAIMDTLDGTSTSTDTPLVTKTDTQTLTNKTISGASNTLTVREADLSLADNTTGNVSTTKHGLVPKAPNDTSKYLRGDATWTAVSGSIVQVVSATYATNTTSSSASYADTGLTATITPTSSSNKILVIVNQAGLQKNTSDTNNGITLQLLRGSTVLAVFATAVGFTYGGTFALLGSAGTSYLDSPATTSATTYKTQQKGENTSTIGTQANSGRSTITLLEIAA